MRKGMSPHRKHLTTSLSTSYFSFILTIDLIEGCAPGVLLGTKKDEVVEDIVEGEAEETLSLVAPSDLATPPAASSILTTSCYLYLYPYLKVICWKYE
jgi:hypothetical protein